MNPEKSIWAELLLLLVALMWGGGFIAGKLALNVLSPLWLIFFRFFFSGCILLSVSFVSLKKIEKRTVQMGILLGVIMFLGFCCQTVGLKYTDASKQGFLIAVYTVIVPFLSWIITKSKPTLNHLLAGIITLLGVALLSLNRTFTLSYGDCLSLGFAFFFALQIVLTGFFAKNSDVLHLTAFQMMTTGILAAIGILFTHQSIPAHYFNEMPAILYMIFICTLCAFFLQNMAQAHTRDSHASIIIAMEAVFGFLLAIGLLHEPLSAQRLFGCGLILAGVLLSKSEKPILQLFKWHFTS